MEYINDYITNVISQDIDDTNNWGNIVAFMDFDGIINKKIFNKYLKYIISNNTILQKNIIKKNNNNYLQDINIDINSYYSLYNSNYKKFDSKINIILNKNNNTHWYFNIYSDKKNKKFRLFFTINHAYADGFKIISILSSSNNKIYKPPLLNRYTHHINYFSILIGTIILLFSYVRIITNLYVFKNHKSSIKYINNTDYIKKTFDFNSIKNKSKELNVTINDLLYSISIKTHYYYYNNQPKTVLIASPFNTGSNNSTNNFCFIFTQLDNSIKKNELITTVNTIFNYYKYSLIIPLLTVIYSIIGVYFCHTLYSKLSSDLDILYTNMIGPKKEEVHFKNNNCNMFNINDNIRLNNTCFLMNHKKNELTFNIISYDNNMNIIISFQKNLYENKKLYYALDCAYNEIIK
jgi:hypothetical protein